MSFRGLIVVSVFAVGCSSSPEKPPARMLGQESQDSLAKVVSDPADERNATITFSPVPAELADLKVGEIFVLPPTKPIARAGLMYRINSMTIAGATLTIEGRQPPLTDLYKDGAIGTDKELTAEDIDMDATMADVLPGEGAMAAGLGPRPTPSFSVTWPRIDFHDDFFLCNGSSICSVDGHITLPHPFINAEMEFDWHGVRRSQFRVNVDAEIAIEIRGRVETPGIGSSVRLFTIHFTPIPIGIWCIIDPRLTIRLGAKAAVGLDVTSAGFSAGAHVTAGNEWVRDRGNLDLSTASATGTAHAEGLTQTTVQADVYSRAEFGFFFYYTAGPYVYFEQGPRLNIATPHHPFAQVGYHVGTGLGGRFDVIDEALLSLADYSLAIYELTVPFWSSSNANPVISTYAPTGNITVQPLDAVAFSAASYDLEDGAATDAQVHWANNVLGPLGTGRNFSHQFYTSGPGLTGVTLTVNDTDGGTDVRTIAVTVATVNPTITAFDPQPGATFYTFTQNPISAMVTSPYFPAGDLCTAPGQYNRWSSDNVNDVIDPFASIGCAGTVTFSSPGSRVLTFRANDKWGQITTRSVTVNAVNAPSCSASITATPTDLTNSGGTTTTMLEAQVNGCILGYDYFVVSSTANGGYHEKVFPNGISKTFNPSVDLADDGFLMIKQFDTSPQTIDVTFNHTWDDGLGNVGGVSPPTPTHLHFLWH